MRFFLHAIKEPPHPEGATGESRERVSKDAKRFCNALRQSIRQRSPDLSRERLIV